MERPDQPPYGFSAKSYFQLVSDGILQEDDHVELLDGMIVSEPPQTPEHASTISQAEAALRRALGARAHVRAQMPLVLGESSVPEPDVAVVPGKSADYFHAHPTAALLVVEVSQSTLPQDRLTKSRIYAGAAIPEYWILNLREGVVEVLTDVDPDQRMYASHRKLGRRAKITLSQFHDIEVAVAHLLRGAE